MLGTVAGVEPSHFGFGSGMLITAGSALPPLSAIKLREQSCPVRIMPAGLPRGSSYRPAWRFDLAKHFGGSDAKSGGHGAFDDPPDAQAVARLLQNTEEENVEDIDLALRAITYCPHDARVNLQALKMIGIIAYRHPDARSFIAQQVTATIHSWIAPPPHVGPERALTASWRSSEALH